MTTYTVNCSDGGDPHCYKTVEVEIDVQNLTIEQLEDIEKDCGTLITKEQVKISSIYLNEDERQELNKEGEVYYACDINNVCSACGSDQDYDDEGNNITAL